MPTKQPPIPTADQEALQEPTVDPVYLAAGGVAGGLSEMLSGGAAARDWYQTMGAIDPSEAFGPWEDGLKGFLARHQNMPLDAAKGAYNSIVNSTKMQVINHLLNRNSQIAKASTLPVGSEPTGALQRMLGSAERNVNTLKIPDDPE